jgi:hypothetical protein
MLQSIAHALTCLPTIGPITSVMVVGASLGEMLIPLAVANVSFKWYEPVTFLYILLACSAASLAVYISMLIVGQPIKKDPHKHVAIVIEEELGESLQLTSKANEDAYGTFVRSD